MLNDDGYSALEEEIFNTKNISMSFRPGDKVELRLGVVGGRSKVSVLMPWGNIYDLNTYVSEEQARQEYNKYSTQLKESYTIHITGLRTAEIIAPK
ncbi:hypothetical protein HN747_01320 [archaeon]|jgi:hypothetical protein|nr:hypothetical protein [archaeon]